MKNKQHTNNQLTRQGFILLYRKARQNFLWEPGRPRTKFEAWLDILLEAQHSYESQPVLVKGTLLHCHRGECLKSLESWAQRWGWSKTKTRNYLKSLENETMIVLKSERKTTRLSVVNYDTYQISRNSDENAKKTQTGRQTIPQAIHRQRMFKECEKNEGEGNGDTPAFKLFEFLTAAAEIGISDSEAQSAFEHYEQQGFCFGNGLPIPGPEEALKRWLRHAGDFGDRDGNSNKLCVVDKQPGFKYQMYRGGRHKVWLCKNCFNAFNGTSWGSLPVEAIKERVFAGKANVSANNR